MFATVYSKVVVVSNDFAVNYSKRFFLAKKKWQKSRNHPQPLSWFLVGLRMNTRPIKTTINFKFANFCSFFIFFYFLIFLNFFLFFFVF